MNDEGSSQHGDVMICARCAPDIRPRRRIGQKIAQCAHCGTPVGAGSQRAALVPASDTSGTVARQQSPSPQRAKGRICTRDARLSWILAALAGLIGAAAFTHSAGYFVTFMTGNSERAILGFFRHEAWLSIAAGLLLLSFVAGVVTASLCRRHLWQGGHPHGPTVLTALSVLVAAIVDVGVDGWSTNQVSFVPVLFAAFGIGALNTSFVKNGEVSIPLSYVTGTLVKLGQGIERHISGGRAGEWLGYFWLWFSFVTGATAGGCISLVVSGSQMLAVAAFASAVTSGYTHFHADRRARRL